LFLPPWSFFSRAPLNQSKSSLPPLSESLLTFRFVSIPGAWTPFLCMAHRSNLVLCLPSDFWSFLPSWSFLSGAFMNQSKSFLPSPLRSVVKVLIFRVHTSHSTFMQDRQFVTPTVAVILALSLFANHLSLCESK
jgi:hypothetical protein